MEDFFNLLYQVILIGASIIGLRKYSTFDAPMKIITVYIVTTLISETLAIILAFTIKNNLLVYHIYSPVQLTLIAYFFNYTITDFKKKNIALYVSVIGAIASILNAIFLQHPITDFNNNILVFESVLIISMSLYYFYSYLRNDENISYNISTEFWVTCLILLFWSCTFLYWLMKPVLIFKYNKYATTFETLSWIVNIITYGGIGLLLLKHKRIASE